MSLVSIKGIDKAKLLQQLYNNATTCRFFQLYGDGYKLRIKYSDAQELCNTRLKFDILYCKNLFVDISSDIVNTDNYEKEYGWGSITKIVNYLRQ